MQTYYRIQTLGDRTDKTLAFFRKAPDGIGLKVYYLRRGIRLGEHYPADAALSMEDRDPGIKLASLLGNTLSFLVVHQAMKVALEAVCQCEIEYLPVRVLNHKKRVHSTEYWIVNPLGTVDLVDRGASEIDFDDDGKTILGIRRLVFVRARLAGAPAMLRVPEKPEEIFIGTEVIKALAPHGFTNVILHEVESR